MAKKKAKARFPNAKPKVAQGSDPNVPYRIRNLQEVRPVVAALANDLYARSWKGKAGLTDRSAYVAQLRVAWEHGELISSSGVRIELSMRQWAELTGVRLPTINNSRKRLTREHKLIRRDGRGFGPRSGAFVLLCDPARIETLTQGVSNKEQSIEEGYLECFISRASLRWGAGKLGKTKEALLDGVRRLRFPTEKELAVLLNREGGVHHLRKHLKELVGLGILKCQGGRYLFPEFGAFCLNFERADNGELDTDERVRTEHAEQRARFLDDWTKGEVRSKSKSSKSGRKIAQPEEEVAERGVAATGNATAKAAKAPVAEPSQAAPDLEVLKSPAEVFGLARQYFGGNKGAANRPVPTQRTKKSTADKRGKREGVTQREGSP